MIHQIGDSSTLYAQEAEYEGEVLDSLEELDTIEELEAALQDYYG